MRLKNKKTGEIVPASNIAVGIGNDGKWYDSLAKLNSEWEDAPEESKEYWYIENNGDIDKETYDGDEYEEKMIEIGNYFETKEEAEKAVEKLKAWKRLKDNGFRFTLTPATGPLDTIQGKFQIEISADMPEKWFCHNDVIEDLDACFGGEE